MDLSKDYLVWYLWELGNSRILEGDDFEYYANRISDLLPLDAIDWLESGNDLWGVSMAHNKRLQLKNWTLRTHFTAEARRYVKP